MKYIIVKQHGGKFTKYNTRSYMDTCDSYEDAMEVAKHLTGGIL